MKNKISISQKILIYIPLIVVVMYTIFTLIIFKFGIIRWDKVNVNSAIIYTVFVYMGFSIGYWLCTNIWMRRQQKKIMEERVSISVYNKMGVWIFRVGAVLSIIYSVSWIVQTFGIDIFKFLKAPGAAYDLVNFLGKIYDSGSTVEYPMWFRWISRINTVFGGISTAAVCIGAYEFRRYKIIDKILYVIMIIVSVIYAWMLGKQSMFLILVLEITISLGACYITEIQDGLNGKTIRRILKEKKKILVYYIMCIVLMLIVLGGLMGVMQNDRVEQRKIRTKLYYDVQEKQGSVSAEMLEYFVAQSVEMRTGYSFEKSPVYEIMKYRYAEPINYFAKNVVMSGDKNDEMNEDNSSDSNIMYIDDAEAQEVTLQNNFTDIDVYYTTRSKPEKMTGALYYGLQSLEMYLTQGYASMALAFDLDFRWSYLIGNSRYLSSIAEDMLGLKIVENTYPGQNERVNGWSREVYFNTIYTWLASDLTFIGVIVLFSLIGALFAKMWLEIILFKNVFAVPMCYLISYTVICASQNNVLFNALGAIFTTIMLMTIYVGGCIFNKWYIKKRK